jgi:hypothetical protein
LEAGPTSPANVSRCIDISENSSGTLKAHAFLSGSKRNEIVNGSIPIELTGHGGSSCDIFSWTFSR